MSVPALRFKDDKRQDFPDWNAQTFEQVCKINQGLQIPISERFAESGRNKHFYITNEFLRKNSDKQYFIENPPASVLCNKDDVLMTRTGNTGKVVTGVNGAFHNNFFKINYDRSLLNKTFLCEFLSLDKTQSLILKLAGTSTIPDLNHSDFYKIKIHLPALQEQAKIANFLTSVDEKITQLFHKCELLAQYKKGVMQQIFSQKIRFKGDDGQDFPEWEEAMLGDVLDYEQPTKYLVSSTEYDDSYETPVLTAGKTFVLGYTDEVNGIFEHGLPVIIFDDFTTAFKFVTFPFKAKSSAMKILKLNSASNNIKFIYEVMGTLDLPTGDEHKRYWISEYSKLLFQLPCLKEQTKIANFLTAIDDKIIQTQKQLAAVKQYKQGLLQQMFV